MEDHTTQVNVGGIGFCSLLTLIFITLKLIGKIDWSWIWVLSPIWIPFALVFSLVIVCLLVVFFRGQTIEF